jgi:hypothetical protein
MKGIERRVADLESTNSKRKIIFVLGDDPVPPEAVGCEVFRLRWRGPVQPTAFPRLQGGEAEKDAEHGSTYRHRPGRAVETPQAEG